MAALRTEPIGLQSAQIVIALDTLVVSRKQLQPLLAHSTPGGLFQPIRTRDKVKPSLTWVWPIISPVIIAASAVLHATVSPPSDSHRSFANPPWNEIKDDMSEAIDGVINARPIGTLANGRTD